MKEYEAHRKGEDVLRKCIDAIYKETDTDAAVDKVLSLVAKFYDAERCYLYEYDEEISISVPLKVPETVAGVICEG